MNRAFWEGFLFGLNPMNSGRVLFNIWRGLRKAPPVATGVKEDGRD